MAPPNTGSRSFRPAAAAPIPRDIVAVDHRLDHPDLRMGRKQAQRMTDDGRAMQGAVLLRRIASGAGSAPGRDHHDRNFARITHPLTVRDG